MQHSSRQRRSSLPPVAEQVIARAAVPWYREPWPWILLALPGSAVVAGVVTLIIAIVHEDALVADDYYKQGLAINRVLARESRAAQLGLRARVDVRGNQLRVQLAGANETPDELIARFVHPTRAGEDRHVVLAAIAPGWYQAGLPPLAAGRWRFQLEDAGATWRLSGEWMSGQAGMLITASDTL